MIIGQFGERDDLAGMIRDHVSFAVRDEAAARRRLRDALRDIGEASVLQRRPGAQLGHREALGLLHAVARPVGAVLADTHRVMPHAEKAGGVHGQLPVQQRLLAVLLQALGADHVELHAVLFLADVHVAAEGLGGLSALCADRPPERSAGGPPRPSAATSTDARRECRASENRWARSRMPESAGNRRSSASTHPAG